MFYSISVVGEKAISTERKKKVFVPTLDDVQTSDLEGINTKIIELLKENL